MPLKQFDEYLHEFDEVGVVTEIRQAVVYVAGLPRVKQQEVVMMETGELGHVMALKEEYVEVLIFTASRLKVGLKVVRTGETLSVPVADSVLGGVLDPLGYPLIGETMVDGAFERRPLDVLPAGIDKRQTITEPLETGVALVDLLVPLGKGQRELVIGDRKLGKTQFIQQTMVSHARQGGVCVYGGIARRLSDVHHMHEYIDTQGIASRTVMVVSLASQSAGLVYITPYSAMTMAEYFRDKGFDVLVILDDMTIHAKYYREMSLLSQRYPGRSAYPGDVFYTHARLMERAGKFEKGSITCLAIAETAMGDIRGYIQTNLMSMTDGHILFDHEYANQGRLPPINPFLSVTRVGRQTRSPLLKNLSRQITSFLVHYEKLKKLMHFGEELSGDVKKNLLMGERMVAFFDQAGELVMPLTVSAIFATSIWSGMWEGVEIPSMQAQLLRVLNSYYHDNQVKTALDSVLTSCQTVQQLTESLRPFKALLLGENHG